MLAMGEGRFGRADTSDSTVYMLEPRTRGEGRRDRLRIFGEGFNRVIRKAVEKVCLPVRLAARRKPRTEHALHLDIADRPDQVGDRRSEAPQRRQHLFPVRERPAIAACDAYDR